MYFNNNFGNQFYNNTNYNNYNLNNYPNFGHNSMNFNNNCFPYYNMNFNNTINFNGSMLMNNIQNMAMYNNMLANQNLAMMNQITMQKRNIAMNKYLNESLNKNTNDNPNNYVNNNYINIDNNNQERDIQRELAVKDVSQETQIQEQNKANQMNQLNQNNNYEEIDPTFMESFISDKQLFDGNGHKIQEKWAHGENRGGRVYNPPNGWIGFGLNVLGKYDNGNNDWLACNGRPGEWCVAYHGACVRNTSDEIKQIIKPILENNLKPGAGQGYSSYDDAMHPGQKVGVGVYCSPNPANMDGYAGTIEVNGYRYKVAFMLRVKPDKIRYANARPDYWVLNAGNGDFSEMRPYRFLIKKTS